MPDAKVEMPINSVAAPSRGSAFRRLLLAIGSTGIHQVISVLQTIVLVPLFIRAWGADSYGRWLSILALVSYLSLLDLGGQSHVANQLTVDFNRGDMRNFVRRLSEAGSFFLGVSVTALGLLVLGLFGIAPLFRGTVAVPLFAGDARWIALFVSVSILLTIPGGIYITAYRAIGLFVHAMMLGNAMRFGELLAYATLMILAVPPIVYAFALMVGSVLRTTIFLYDQWRHVPCFSDIRISARLAWRGRACLKGSLLFWLLSLATSLNQQGVLMVVAVFVGARGVAEYSTQRSFAGLVGYVAMLAQAPLWTEFSHMWAQDRRSDIRRMAISAVKTVSLVSGLAALLVWMIVPVLYPLWTHHALRLNPSLLLLFMVQGVLASAWSTAGWSLLAANHQRLPALWSLGNAAITMVLAILLAPRFGNYGVASATLIGDVCCGLLVMPALTARFLGMPVLRLYRTVFLLMTTIAALAIGTFVIVHALHAWPGKLATTAFIAIWTVLASRAALGKAGTRQIQAAIRRCGLRAPGL